MSNTEKSALIAQEWITKAENDLKNASYTLRLGKKCPTDTVCFHSQQYIEKYLKALLIVLDNHSRALTISKPLFPFCRKAYISL